MKRMTNKKEDLSKPASKKIVLEGIDSVLGAIQTLSDKVEMIGKNVEKVGQDVKWIKQDVNDLKADAVSRSEFSELKRKVDEYHPLN